MPGRNFNANQYRYGFNGMEKDDEIKGDGNSYTSEYRAYDSRLGRWMSIDPEVKKLAGQSPYVNNNNNPIYFTDPKGDFGVVGALIGAAIGGVASLTKSVLQDGWGALKDGKTWAKAGVNAGAGAIVGATGGLAAGVIATAATSFATSLAEDAIDGKKLDYEKATVSSIISTATFGLAKYVGGKLSTNVSRNWWTRGNVGSFTRWLGRNPTTNVGQVVDRTTDVVNLGEGLVIDKLYPGVKEKVIEIDLPEVTINADKDTKKIPESEVQKKGEEIKKTGEGEINKVE